MTTTEARPVEVPTPSWWDEPWTTPERRQGWEAGVRDATDATVRAAITSSTRDAIEARSTADPPHHEVIAVPDIDAVICEIPLMDTWVYALIARQFDGLLRVYVYDHAVDHGATTALANALDAALPVTR